MNNLEIIKNKFPNIEITGEKIETNENIYELLKFLKNTPELSFDMLFSIVAVDYVEYVELIYVIFSVYLNKKLYVSAKVIDKAVSVISLYNSAYFDECEIFDLFGINFIGNDDIHRLFMPESWIGHPLRKNYKLQDERLAWNE